ncbi:MAG: UDP-N-acetylmuramate dehydrogenase [Proteobacteria bacterium]|jgi:UDP-N-acetylmuramate dehydrogenase|nr:UDP-N-acetylmuramate dehydrogenase [Pseudomonadota bacterium]MCG6934556.1 UDP-N-acetylmuramate dehydrogenase [Pseudomonadota bacterium]
MMTAPTLQHLRGTLRFEEPMARHTSWRAGGAVERFYLPADLDDLALYLTSLPMDESIWFVGLGSNLLVRDGGLSGTVIGLSGCLSQLDILAQNRVRVEAGVACPKLARTTAKAGLAGLEFLCGVPGTLGGALAMNAGALGSETWEFVTELETLDRQGQRHVRTPGDYEVGYRHVAGPEGEWFVAATFKLAKGDVHVSLEKIKANLARRAATQPTHQPNAGSVFRNPPGDYAARLIETCGLKGHCIGGACVSEKHANFIINTGTATAGDIEALIDKVAQTVQQEHGIELMREVRIVGERGGRDGG